MRGTRDFFGTFAILALLPTAFNMSFGAVRPCVDNYSESESNNRKSFRSFVESRGVSGEKATKAAAQALAAEGYLGLSADKDLGIVSAYQENGGKRSSITFTISEASEDIVRIEVMVLLAEGLRTPTGAAREHLCKLLEASLPREQRNTTSSSEVPSSGLALKTDGGLVALSSTMGSNIQVSDHVITKAFYTDFKGARASVRTLAKRPTLLIWSKNDPSKQYVLVRVDSDEDDDKRSLKISSAGKLVKASFTGKLDLAPDEDWTLPFEASSQADGVWQVVPIKELKPGEYGLWDLESMGLASFGIDKTGKD